MDTARLKGEENIERMMVYRLYAVVGVEVVDFVAKISISAGAVLLLDDASV